MNKKIIIMVSVALIVAMAVTAFPLHIEPGHNSDWPFVVTIGSPVSAQEADYTCDGANDDVQFQSALNALPYSGGQLFVLAGNYTFADSTTVTRAIDNVSIIGVSAAVSITGDGTTAIFTAGGNNWLFSNLELDSGGLAMGATTDYMWLHVIVDSTYYPLKTDAINIEDHSALHGVGGADTIFPADPGADKYLMWDDDPGQLAWSDAGAGDGDMTKAVYDQDEDGDIDTAAGGTEWDSSAATGVAYITAGAWGTRSTGISNTYIVVVDDADAANGDIPYFTTSGLAGYNEAEFKSAYNMEAGTDYQGYDAELAAIAGLTSAADKVIYFTGSGTADVSDFTAFARTILDDANEATFKATVNLEIGTDVLAQQTIGIADDNLLEVDGSPNDDEYARFTANGLEGRTEAEFKADFNLEIGTDIISKSTFDTHVADTAAHNVTRSVTLTVAASDASTLFKSQADYLCDGTADQSEIESAMAALPAVGGTIQLSSGTFTVTGTIAIPSYTSLLGQGEGVTVIKVADNTAITPIRNQNGWVADEGDEYITLRDFTVDGNEANQSDTSTTRHGISLARIRDTVLENIEIEEVECGTAGYGLIVSGQGQPSISRQCLLHNVNVHDNVGTGVRIQWGEREFQVIGLNVHDNDNHGVMIDHSEGSYTNIQADSNGDYGIYIRNVFSDNLNGLSATRNGQHGIFIAGLTDSAGAGWVAKNNGQDTSDTYSDIYFDDDNSMSYGRTNDVSLAGVAVGGTTYLGTATEKYGIEFENSDSVTYSGLWISGFTCGSTQTSDVSCIDYIAKKDTMFPTLMSMTETFMFDPTDASSKWQEYTVNSGSIDLWNPMYLRLSTGATINSYEGIYTDSSSAITTTGTIITWFTAWGGTDRTLSTVWLGLWDWTGHTTPPTLTQEHFGFKVINGDIYSTTADGTTEEAYDTGVSYSAAYNPHTLTMRCYGGEISAYVDGTLVAIHDTNLPVFSTCYIWHSITNTVAADRRIALKEIVIEFP